MFYNTKLAVAVLKDHIHEWSTSERDTEIIIEAFYTAMLNSGWSREDCMKVRNEVSESFILPN